LQKQRGVQRALPVSLENAIANDPLKRNLTVDSWGTPLLYRPNPANQTYTLTSAGKDRQLYTPDDVVVKEGGATAR